ncbi:hypothetical protein PENTCL1PPCAC_8842 [Pristionchus entomophagus]|uniref:FAS1 domain-containing protein n=1 Tax=Pristionchus entomophagus TaxID=358040 RepID=A0AAV5STJ4_9BILA|nr:hypothetical protein PENTCL1PPCAC_8842 [Pristionchus entomophagus]
MREFRRMMRILLCFCFSFAIVSCTPPVNRLNHTPHSKPLSIDEPTVFTNENQQEPIDDDVTDWYFGASNGDGSRSSFAIGKHNIDLDLPYAYIRVNAFFNSSGQLVDASLADVNAMVVSEIERSLILLDTAAQQFVHNLGSTLLDSIKNSPENRLLVIPHWNVIAAYDDLPNASIEALRRTFLLHLSIRTIQYPDNYRVTSYVHIRVMPEQPKASSEDSWANSDEEE